MPRHANDNRNRRYQVKTGDGFMKRLITDRQLKEKLGGCSNMMIWRLRREGKLPKPKKLGNRNVTPEDEADKAIQRLIGG
jgi:predicted DNA-binding transcriptional regulator AlpA